jgi:glyoxylase I family protein
MMKFSHIALTCSDPLALERFYSQYFGFKRTRVFDLGNGAQLVFTRSGDVSLEIFPTQDTRPVDAPDKDGYPYPGVRHIAFQVDNVDAKLAEMGSDAHITLGPLDFDAFIPGWRTVWVSDPEGNIVEISQGFTEDASTPALE